MYYLCHTKEERAAITRVLSSFLAENLTYKGAITSDVEKNTSEINFFLGVFVEFFRQVVVIISDVEPQKVKLHLFSQGADLTFRGPTQVKVVRSCHKKLWPLIKQKPKKPLALDAKCLWRDI